MTERMIQVPESLIEGLLDGFGNRRARAVRDARALLSQPTPTADSEVEYALDVDGSTLSVSTEQADPEELQGHIPGSTVVSRTVTYTEWTPVDQSAEPCCSRPGDPNWHTANGDHVVPPDTEDDEIWTVQDNRVAVCSIHGVGRYLDVFDPSTIRDVTPPEKNL